MVDAAILSQWVVNLGRRDAKARLSHLVCEMAIRLGAAREGSVTLFPFAVRQAQLAKATGMTHVHVNRMVRVLREAGLADIREQSVRILDWKGLVRAAEFDEEYLQINCPPEDRVRIAPGF